MNYWTFECTSFAGCHKSKKCQSSVYLISVTVVVAGQIGYSSFWTDQFIQSSQPYFDHVNYSLINPDCFHFILCALINCSIHYVSYFCLTINIESRMIKMSLFTGFLQCTSLLFVVSMPSLRLSDCLFRWMIVWNIRIQVPFSYLAYLISLYTNAI